MKQKPKVNPLLTQQMLAVMEETIENTSKGEKETEVNEMLNNFLTYVLKSLTKDVLNKIKDSTFVFDEFIKTVIDVDSNTKYRIDNVKQKYIVIECDDIYNKSTTYKNVPIKKFEDFIKKINLSYDTLDNVDETETSDIVFLNLIIDNLVNKLKEEKCVDSD